MGKSSASIVSVFSKLCGLCSASVVSVCAQQGTLSVLRQVFMRLCSASSRSVLSQQGVSVEPAWRQFYDGFGRSSASMVSVFSKEVPACDACCKSGSASGAMVPWFWSAEAHQRILSEWRGFLKECGNHGIILNVTEQCENSQRQKSQRCEVFPLTPPWR